MTSAIDDLWGRATPRTSDSSDNPETDPSIPDGEYDAEILDFRCFLDKKGRWWMKWILAVRGGLLDGRLLVRFVEVKATTASYLKADVLHCLGREATFGGEIADIGRGLTGPAGREMVGSIVRARKRSRRADNGETYLDVYINGTVSLGSAPPPVGAPEGADGPDGHRVNHGEPPTLPDAPSIDGGRFDSAPFPGDEHAPPEEDDIPF